MATDVLTAPTIVGTATRTRVYKNFIDGEWVEASTGETFEDGNPADTRDVVGIFQKSAKADVDAAVDAAKRASPNGVSCRLLAARKSSIVPPKCWSSARKNTPAT